MLTGQILKQMAAGLFSADSSADEERAAHAIVRRTVPCLISDGGVAGAGNGDGVAAYINPMASDSARLLGAKLSLPVGVNGSSTDYATITLTWVKADASDDAVLASWTSLDLTDALVFDEFATLGFTLASPRGPILAPGDSIIATLTKNGEAGAAIATATAAALVQLLIEEAVGT